MDVLKSFQNEKEVEVFAKESGKKVVIFESSVYDVECFLESHPGGKDVLLQNLAKNIDQLYYDAGHTASARLLFQDLYKVGIIIGGEGDSIKEPVAIEGQKLTSKLKLDYTKALYPQLVKGDFTWDDYIAFINEPKHLINPVRNIKVYDNPVFETLTSTPYWLIPIVWAYPFYYCLSMGYWTDKLIETIVYFIIGNFYWTMFEYVFHRYLLHSENHWLPNHPQAMAFHFLLHGIHHSFPHDKYHLVFPIVPGYIALNIVMYPLNVYLPDYVSHPICAGFIFAYVYYDMVHYWFHNSSPQGSYMKGLKAHHMQHHYRDGKMGFGISSRFWDHVFLTGGQLYGAKVKRTVVLPQDKDKAPLVPNN